MPGLPSRLNTNHAAPHIVVVNEQMLELLESARRAASSGAKVLLTGESGTGKDIVARHIHFNSPRASAEFVAVNCAGVTESLLESELFGHVKGSFTGAYRDKVGKLQLANGGTLLLDEVGEMSLRMQALLLRFLENGEIQAVGADTTQDHRRCSSDRGHASKSPRNGQRRAVSRRSALSLAGAPPARATAPRAQRRNQATGERIHGKAWPARGTDR